ncbi:MAG: transposase [Acidimicrobiia bacterium]|nr:transposase [Acidimicrobiia bacterium]
MRLAWHAKETLRGLDDIDCLKLAGAYLTELADDLQDTDSPPALRRLGRTLVRWHTHIVNWHRARVSNPLPARSQEPADVHSHRQLAPRPRFERPHRGDHSLERVGGCRRCR